MSERRTLVIGFGNIYRRDDGVGAAVVHALRDRLGYPPLSPDEDGWDDRGRSVDTILVHQLTPDLAEVLGEYDRVIFVDAHIQAMGEPIREERLDACYRTTTVSHVMHPCTLLALAQMMHGQAPEGILLSVRGHDFDFGEGLSPETAALVDEVVERVLTLVEGEHA